MRRSVEKHSAPNEGTSVRWYTELNPIPKRPVFPICVFLTESPTRLMDVKSSCERGRERSIGIVVKKRKDSR